MKRKSTSHGPLERMARATLRESLTSMRKVEQSCARAVAAASEIMITCLENGGSLYFCGNGGSAADAQHLACELSGRYLFDRPSLAATALTTNSSSLTAIGNDYGYDQVFSRQLQGLGRPGDVLVAITTSGRSRSVLKAVATAHRLGLTVVGMTGAQGSGFAAQCDVALITPSFSTPKIQEGHIAMGHAFCELIERALFESQQTAKPAPAARRRPAARGRKAGRGSRRKR